MMKNNTLTSGDSGRKIRIKTNIFPIKALSNAVCYQYDVSTVPEVPTEVCRKAFRQCERLIKNTNPDSWFVYDGVKSAYSMTSIGDTTFDVIVEKECAKETSSTGQSQQGSQVNKRGGRSFENKPDFAPAPDSVLQPVKILTESSAVGAHEKISVKISQVSQVDFHNLLLYAQGKSINSDSVTHACTALSAALRYVPSLLYVSIGSNFFSSHGCTDIDGGLQVWRGYHQSVRVLMAGHLGINVDIASSVFRKGGITLIEYLYDVFGVRDVQDILRQPPDAINRMIKGVNVVTNHRGDQKQRFKISKLSRETAKSMKFEGRDKKMISVAEYFEKEYSIKLKYAHLPLVLKGNGKTAFPIECLSIIPSQRYIGRLNGRQTADMLAATSQKPETRRKQIESAIERTLKYDQNEYLRSFGLEIGNQLMEVDGRVLPSPDVIFHRDQIIRGTEGAWNLRGVKLVDAPELKSCAFVFFCKTDTANAITIRDRVLNVWITAGMNIQCRDAPVLLCNPQIPGNVRGGLMAAFKEATELFKWRCQMIICIVDGSKPLYEQIKRICLCEAGLMSQCMVFKNVIKGNPQYLSNVAMKANIKLGGSTNHITLPLSAVPTMYMGVDVTHPSASSSEPSIAAIVSSTNSQVTKFNTYLRTQSYRMEIVEEMRGVSFLALEDYKKKNDGFPARIIVYRDGVGQGQFDEIRNVEIRALKSAMESIKCEAKLTYIIVQKRHHVRLFPVGHENQDKSSNCVPGTIVDSEITRPGDFNFVLQSHAGMSRPTFYHLIHDENNFESDDIEQISYNLCFLSERATRSISLPAPAYRAHLAAYYSKMFLESDGSSDDGSTKCSGNKTLLTLKRFASGVENHMYYM